MQSEGDSREPSSTSDAVQPQAAARIAVPPGRGVRDLHMIGSQCQRRGPRMAWGAPPITPGSAPGRLGLPCTPCGGNGARIDAPESACRELPLGRANQSPCVFDLASRAYRRAIAALCGYSDPLKLSRWRPGRFRPAPRLLHLDARPVELHADPTASVGSVSSTRHRVSPRANTTAAAVTALGAGDQRDGDAGQGAEGDHGDSRSHGEGD